MINPMQFHLPMQPYVVLQARAIMQLAASPILHLSQDDSFNRSTAVWPSCHIQMDKDALVAIDSAIPQVAQAGSHWVGELSNVTLECSSA